jgi:hypothetical protein
MWFKRGIKAKLGCTSPEPGRAVLQTLFLSFDEKQRYQNGGRGIAYPLRLSGEFRFLDFQYDEIWVRSGPNTRSC